MKYRAYILTFFAYVFMHSLRTGYSYSKPFFQSQFQLSNIFLAFLDFSIYFTMGIGFLTRYLSMNKETMIRNFMIAGVTFSLAYALFSVLAITNVITSSNAIPFSLILMMVFGFFQMHCWPVSLVIINDYFTNEEDGMEIAFWSSAGNVGNIFGFLIPSLMVVNAHLPWEVPQIFMGVALFLITLSVYFFVVRKKDLQKNEYLELEQEPKAEEIGCSEMMEGFKKYMSTM